jgi:hypothetical protein
MTRIIFLLALLASSCKSYDYNAFDTSTTKASAEVYEVDTLSFYFPDSSFVRRGQYSEVDIHRLSWFSGMLRALKEPILYDKTGAEEIYRFTCLRTFNPPFSIRVQHKEGQSNLVLKISDGAGGYTSKKLTTNSTKTLSNEQWQQVLLAINQADFWNMPTHKQAFGSDGSEWIIEGIKNGRYHVVDRWTPRGNDAYRSLGNTFIDLSGVRIKPLY